MVLNSPRLIPALRSRYCGMAWYFSNSARQPDAFSGGTTPVTGFHSTIDRPDSVSRVAPPTTSVTNISAATASSQRRTARRRGGGAGGRGRSGRCGLGGEEIRGRFGDPPFGSEALCGKLLAHGKAPPGDIFGGAAPAMLARDRASNREAKAGAAGLAVARA